MSLFTIHQTRPLPSVPTVTGLRSKRRQFFDRMHERARGFESSQKSKRSRSIVDVNEAPLLKHKEPLLNDLLTFNPTNRKEPPHDCVVLIENQSKKCYYLYKKVYVTVF